MRSNSLPLACAALLALAATTLNAGEPLPFPEPAAPDIPARVLAVTAFGAVGDGHTLATDAFARAFAAASAAGGGRVEVPAGVFLTGPIVLASHTALVLDKGAVILGTTDFAAYEWPPGKGPAGGDNVFNEAVPLLQPLVYASHLTDVEISGQGTIDGQGLPWWDRVYAERRAGVRNPAEGAAPGDKSAGPRPRPRQVLIGDCTRVRVSGITCANAANFNFLLYRCDGVVVDGVTVTAPSNSPNTDGIDPYSSRNVVIRGCHIAVGDDNISFKSGLADGPLENIAVIGCAFGSGHGASIGSNLGAGIRHILVRDCSFTGTETAIRIKSARDRGAVVEDARYEGITMDGVGWPVYIDMFYFDKKGLRENSPHPITATTPLVRNVTIERVTSTDSAHSIYAVGLPERPLSGIVLRDVSISGARKAGVTVLNAPGLVLRNVSVNGTALGPP